MSSFRHFNIIFCLIILVSTSAMFTVGILLGYDAGEESVRHEAIKNHAGDYELINGKIEFTWKIQGFDNT